MFRVAVVGSGPAGLYAADEIIRKAGDEMTVDVIDRLPTPYGLVRYGVAPDHPRIKSIILALQRVLERDNVRFLGDVEVGSAVTADELASCYHAVLYATGASRDRRLELAGEDLEGSISATDFVSWYSGHPDNLTGFDLSGHTTAAVIGAGNVALDVARILAKSVEELSMTDMPEHVLDVLRESSVRDVHIVARRGPQHAKFTTKEIRELGDLNDVDVIIDPSLLPEVDADEFGPVVAANIAALRDLAQHSTGSASRRIHFHFWSRPLLITGGDAVEALELSITAVDDDGAVCDTGAHHRLSVDLVVRSVGYLSVPVHGVPFDTARGQVPNAGGRIVDPEGTVLPGHYVAGWVKRGPSGVIGTNRACASETVTKLFADLEAGLIGQPTTTIDELLAAKRVTPVTYDGWLAIDSGEVELGAASGRARSKIADWTTLRRLGLADQASTR